MPLIDAKKTVGLMMKLEDFLADRPMWLTMFNKIPRRLRGSLGTRSATKIFTEYFLRNQWGDKESFSGSGSNLSETKTIRRDLPLLLRKYGIESILDVPCGDYNWMKETDLCGIKYIGADIVKKLIDANNSTYGAEKVMFIQLDIIKDQIPKVDLLFVRDCLVHFSYSDAFRALQNICASGSQYILTTTFTCGVRNRNISTGDWRPLNLQEAPFSFPEPLRIIYEDHPVAEYSDKALALWRIRDVANCVPRRQA